jgi:hypothetical protein
MLAVTALSLPVVFAFPWAFARLVDRVAAAATRDGRRLAVFVAVLLLAPVLLLAL